MKTYKIDWKIKKLLILMNKLDKDIKYSYWKYYNNSSIEDLYNRYSYNDLFDFYDRLIFSYKKLKKIYIKTKLELDYAIKNNNEILDFQNKMKSYINWYYTNI